jgi:hypothetical protein
MANTKKYLRFAGDVSIDKLVITTSRGVFQDVLGQLLQIQIFEDIFSPFITGSIVLKDAHDLTNVFPLIGEEYLQLRVSTPSIPGGVIEGTFHVYRMSDRVNTGDRSVVYELFFISVESIADTNKKISKVFSGKISDIVPPFVLDKQDGIESQKNFVVENTRNSIKYISNFWSPVKNLTFLADNAISESQSASFLFFENRDGFNFVSLENLYKKAPIQQFIKDKYTRDTVPLGGNALNILEDYKRIAEYDVPVSYDFIDRLRSGMLSSKLISYDSTKKTYTVRNYVALKRFESQTHLNKYPMFTEKAPIRVDSKHIIYPRAFETFTSFGDTTNAKIVQERISFLKMAESNKMTITVPGRTDYTVGMTAEVTIHRNRPIQKSDTTDDIIDKTLSGKYLISAINHTITVQGHDCTMELIKDSLIRKV